MSTGAPSAPQKVNLRRPDIMSAVQAQVLSHYRSELVEQIRAHGHVLAAGDLTVKLAKEFGFCYGVTLPTLPAGLTRIAGSSYWERSSITPR
jgi:4-hydroxy-3-methylbut-2-en-1-yl diphosphate reductase